MQDNCNKNEIFPDVAKCCISSVKSIRKKKMKTMELTYDLEIV